MTVEKPCTVPPESPFCGNVEKLCAEPCGFSTVQALFHKRNGGLFPQSTPLIIVVIEFINSYKFISPVDSPQKRLQPESYKNFSMM